MVCHINGRPGQELRPARWRFTELSQTSANPILLQWVAEADVVLEQFSINWNIEQTTTGAFTTLSNESQDGSAFSNDYRTIDASIDKIIDFVCLDRFQWSKGDTVEVRVPNPEDRDIGMVIILEQVDN